MNKKSILAVMLVTSAWCCIFSLFASDFETRFEGVHWLREYYNEVIQKKDRNILLEYVPLIKEEPYYIDYSPDGETIVYWYDDFPRRFDKVSCSTEPAIGGLEYMNIIRIWGKLEYLKVTTLNPNLYEVWIKDIGISQYSYERELKYGHNLEFALSEVEYPLYFKFDGEYLFIYLKDQKTLLSTYCAYDETEYQALVEAVATNNFDNMEFTFPRHADGTCDYDEDTWKSAKKPSSGTSLRTGKSTTVKENLHVHSFDSATSPVSITLAAGTLVEILGVGDEETIDGITSKWVHVKVMPGTLGTDGTYIKWGNVVGWCFGGVVSDMEGMAESASETTGMEEPENAPATEEHAEPAEEATLPEAAGNETSNEEAESTDALAKENADLKQNAALPILPIAAGGMAFAILLAVILLAAKKRKSGKE